MLLPSSQFFEPPLNWKCSAAYDPGTNATRLPQTDKLFFFIWPSIQLREYINFENLRMAGFVYWCPPPRYVRDQLFLVPVKFNFLVPVPVPGLAPHISTPAPFFSQIYFKFSHIRLKFNEVRVKPIQIQSNLVKSKSNSNSVKSKIWIWLELDLDLTGIGFGASLVEIRY